MRFIALATLLVLSAPAVAEGEGAAKPDAAERMRVLVLDLKASGLDPEEAKLIDELLTVELSRQPRFDVISGADVRRMVELEAEKQATGCEDSSCLADIAGAMGARYVVYGRVGKLGERFVLTLNLFDSETAGAVGRAQLKPESIDVIPDELPGAVEQLTAQLLEREGPRASAEAPSPASSKESAGVAPVPEKAAAAQSPMAFVWPLAFVGAGLAVIVAGVGFDLLSPTSNDDTLDGMDLVGPAVIAAGLGAAAFGLFVNPFSGGDDA